jgi:hypothetical protein
MSLPEDELRRLRKIEQALCRDDPEFVRLMRATDPRVQCERKLVCALLGVVIGAGLLAAGAVTHRVYLEAAGVMIVLLALVWAVVSWRRYAAVAVVRAVVSDALKRRVRSSSQPAHDRAHHRTQIRGMACAWQAHAAGCACLRFRLA